MISGGSPTMTKRPSSHVPGELPPELEARLEALADPTRQAPDFDAASWFWLSLLGIALPLALLVWGWGP